MQEILTRAGCFVAIIVLGYALRKMQVFKEEDFKVLSKVVLKLTLPAATIANFAGREIDPSMLVLTLICLGAGVLYMGLGCLISKSGGRQQQAFGLLNLTGYNIGCFTLPFVQSFLGPTGVIATCLFDTGNAVVCLGGAYSVAALLKDNQKFSVKKILKTMVKSVAFDCYLIMITLGLLHISLPSPVVSLAELIGDANAFVAMLMLGIGFKISGDTGNKGTIIKFLAVRYSVAALLALGCFFLLPFALEVRQALVILVFSPIASAAPAFTAELDSDVGLASALNSLSIVCSILIILGLLVML